jgi:hypothetical protein
MSDQLPFIPQVDLEKIILCLNLFRSDKDHEVLSAVRGVNRIMDRLDLTWSKVFVAIIENVREEFVSERPKETTIDGALAQLLEVIKPGSFRNLILDLQAQWVSKGRLSDKQREVILKALKTHAITCKLSQEDTGPETPRA